MALRIVPASDPLPVENIVLTIYAAPGLGKSSLSFTADKPLMLDFDKGAHRAATRGDSVPVSSWSDISSMTAEDLAPYSTIIVDTAGRALDALAADIIAGNPKAGRGDGSLTLQGYGTLKSRFAQWQSFLRSLHKDLVLVCHMDEQKNGDETQERIDAQGASRNEIYKSSDAMCRIRLDGKDQRYLDFDPRQGGFGKNPAQLPKIAFADPRQNPRVLAEVIGQIKGSINAMTEEQAEARKGQEAWSQAIAGAQKAEDFNALMKISQERKYRDFMKRALLDAATAAGLAFDTKVKAFVVAEGVAA
jgi:hypothetical protein